MSWSVLRRILKDIRGQSEYHGLPRRKAELLLLLRQEAPELEVVPTDGSEAALTKVPPQHEISSHEKAREGKQGVDEETSIETACATKAETPIREVLRSLADELNRSQAEMDALAERFEENWYYTVRDVCENMSPEDSTSIGVPLRVTRTILHLGNGSCPNSCPDMTRLRTSAFS